MSIPEYPFTALVNQAQYKLALIIAAISPAVGGVLVTGPRGSAKSTLARALAAVLPEQAPFVTLPLGASEEMLLGSLNLQQILDDQKLAFSPGLLSKAHKGVLYVDEVNLLPDVLVDLLLDVAASGVNCLERDGISHRHASRFLLLGTMNPDEGELRPQLTDRFGLSVVLDGCYDIETRVEIVRLREAFDLAPTEFVARYAEQQAQLSASIASARENLAGVVFPNALRVCIAERCQAANVDGLRADIVWGHAARAHAAWFQRTAVEEVDILAVEELVLAHRRQSPPDRNVTSRPPQQESTSSTQPAQPPASKPFTRPADSFSKQTLENDEPFKKNRDETEQKKIGDWGAMLAQQQATGQVSALKLSRSVSTHKFDTVMGQLRGGKKKGGSVGASSRSRKAGASLDWFRSLVASAGNWPPTRLKFRQAKSARAVLHLVLLDTSGSTLYSRQFALAKAAIVRIAERAYLDREQLLIMGFGNQKIDTLLHCGRSPKELRQFLDGVEAGGGTPLREAVLAANVQSKQLQRANPELQLCSYLITDGKTTQSMEGLSLPGDSVLIDTEKSAVKQGKGRFIAGILGADYFPLPA